MAKKKKKAAKGATTRRTPTKGTRASVEAPAKVSRAQKKKATKKAAKPRKKNGRKTLVEALSEEQLKVLRDQVMEMAGLGFKQEEMVLLIKNPQTDKPIAKDTLRRHFSHELEAGVHEANRKVAKSLFDKATSNDSPQAVTAQIWWTKTRMGWKERQVVEVEDKTGVLVSPASGQSVDQWIAAAKQRSESLPKPRELEEE